MDVIFFLPCKSRVQWFFQCGLQLGSTQSTWELASAANSLAPAQCY
jgi:hypothetical protein